MHNTNEGLTTAARWTFQTCWASDDGSIIRMWSAMQMEGDCMVLSGVEQESYRFGRGHGV